MVLNPFFTQGTTSEQNLVQDLINEQLRTYGVDIFYLPRKYMTENTVIREVVQSKFDSAYLLKHTLTTTINILVLEISYQNLVFSLKMK